MNKFLSLFADHQHKRSFNLAQKYSKIATRLETSPILFPIHTIATAFYCTDQHSIQNKKEKEKYRQKKKKRKKEYMCSWKNPVRFNARFVGLRKSAWSVENGEGPRGNNDRYTVWDK